jgi:GTP-binding protein
LSVAATFVRSAAGAADLPRDGLAEIAMVGRSNVGKSSLINALLGRKIARTSGTPGKTRLANIYRVDARPAFYLVDLPGYGYARGRGSAEEFEALTAAYFGRSPSALLLVDSRHPGLPNDIEAWAWLKYMESTGSVAATKVVATKIDKLARGERIRALRALESVHEHSVLPVSADTGEGLDELWTLISRWANNTIPKGTAETRATAPTRPPQTAPTRPTEATAPETKPRAPRRGRKKSSASTSRR